MSHASIAARTENETKKAVPPVPNAADIGRRSPVVRYALVFLALLGVVLLAALGIWQLERRVWKLDLIDRVEQRVHAPAVPAPGPAAWPAITAKSAEYLHVRLHGRFLNDRETLVQAVTDLGGGFWVLTPFVSDDGFTVLVNRGFVLPEAKDPAARKGGEIGNGTEISGLLRISEPRGGFLRSNDPSHDRWYSRDVAAIAAARGLGDVAPYFIDADAASNSGGWPRGGLTVIRFPNNHLVYALTWFGLAALLAVATGRAIFGGRTRRGGR